MAKPRKKWEPEYLFGNKQGWFLPMPLGENQIRTVIKKPKPKPKKGKK